MTPRSNQSEGHEAGAAEQIAALQREIAALQFSPPPKPVRYGLGFKSLLDEINCIAHMDGTSTVTRDLLQRLHRYVRQKEALLAGAQSVRGHDREAIAWPTADQVTEMINEECFAVDGGCDAYVDGASAAADRIISLYAALAPADPAPGEPVAYRFEQARSVSPDAETKRDVRYWKTRPTVSNTRNVTPLYTHPAPKKPSVHDYVSDYEYRGDQDYKPNEHEQAMLEDAIEGYLAADPAPGEVEPVAWRMRLVAGADGAAGGWSYRDYDPTPYHRRYEYQPLYAAPSPAPVDAVREAFVPAMYFVVTDNFDLFGPFARHIDAVKFAGAKFGMDDGVEWTVKEIRNDAESKP